MAASHDFTIRPVTTEDLEAVLRVYRQCEDFLALGPVAAASMEMVLQDLEISRAEGGVYCGVFDAQGKMIGVVDYVPRGFEGAPESAFLSLLMIAAPYRGGGLGGRIVAQVEALIRQDPRVKYILSGVQVNNPGAMRFWAAQGYRIISEPALLPDGTTTVRLFKEI